MTHDPRLTQPDTPQPDTPQPDTQPDTSRLQDPISTPSATHRHAPRSSAHAHRLAADMDRRGPDHRSAWRRKLYEVIFEAETSAGKSFDIILLVAIGCSVLVVALESVKSYQADYGALFEGIEWFFTFIFTAEYVLRLLCVRSPRRYALSFFGVVDLLSILPNYVSLFVPGAQALLVVRGLRLLRVFRVLKLAAYVEESVQLFQAIQASRRKIGVFLASVLVFQVIVGTILYTVESESSGFTNIPTSVYWAIVTMTTVGYGDIAPQTPLGKLIASFVMLMGFGILAIPTGIVTVELRRAMQSALTRLCEECGVEGHDTDALFCKRCGSPLHQP
jgi:voltage-gated potassium channel